MNIKVFYDIATHRVVYVVAENAEEFNQLEFILIEFEKKLLGVLKRRYEVPLEDLLARSNN